MSDTIHISDSIVFGQSWRTPELFQLFCEQSRVKGWIEVMVILAESQAEQGLIPNKAAQDIRMVYENIIVDDQFLREVAVDFEKTNHSLIGLIRAVQRRSTKLGGEWLCFGATVQDITDTYMCRVLVKVHELLVQRLLAIEKTLMEVAIQHRDTNMCGRTHGQIGLPVTFGFKAAVWLDELDRHRQRLLELKSRIAVVQLAGGVGSLSSFGENAIAIQRRFAQKLGLSAPSITWTTSRDRFAEWVNCLALITATADKIGHETYNLQRPEIGELSEGFIKGTIGSITMPQKQNPEISEHLGTLSRTVRYLAGHMMENLVHDHERDGRSWKSEWLILPEATLAADKVLCLLQELIPNLQVHVEKMQKNLGITNGLIYAEGVMLYLAKTVGKQTAHTMVYNCAMRAIEQQVPFKTALSSDSEIAEIVSSAALERLFDSQNAAGQCQNLIDQVITRIDLN